MQIRFIFHTKGQKTKGQKTKDKGQKTKDNGPLREHRPPSAGRTWTASLIDKGFRAINFFKSIFYAPYSITKERCASRIDQTSNCRRHQIPIGSNFQIPSGSNYKFFKFVTHISWLRDCYRTSATKFLISNF